MFSGKERQNRAGGEKGVCLRWVQSAGALYPRAYRVVVVHLVGKVVLVLRVSHVVVLCLFCCVERAQVLYVEPAEETCGFLGDQVHSDLQNEKATTHYSG
jgi:hypothetical protein